MDQTLPDRGPARASAARIPPVVFVLTGAVAVIGSNSLVLAPIATQVANTFGAAIQTVMIASAAFGLGTAGSALFLARHIDRFGAWRMLRLAFAVLALAFAASALAPLVAVLWAAQLCAGIAAGVALPAIYSNAAAVAPAGRESETVGIVIAGWTLSLVAGVSLSAVLADMLHWRAVYAAVGCLAALAFAGLLADARRDEPASGPAPTPLAALAVPGAAPLLLAQSAFMGSFYGVYGYLGDHVSNGLGLPLSANGVLTLVYGIGFGGPALVDRFLQRFSARAVLVLALFAVVAVYLLMLPAASSYAALLACAFVWGLVNHVGLNMMIVRLTALDRARRGAIMGLNSAATYLAAFAGTLVFGQVYAHLGFAATAATGAALTLLAALAAGR